MDAPILDVRNVSKSFAGSTVLDGVSLQVERNRIVGIVGENGAGKSTLFNVISGIVRPDHGRVELAGREIRPASYRDASRLGISRVFQEQALIPTIPVFENLLLSHEDRFACGGQLLDRRRMIAVAKRIVKAVGLDLDVTRRTSDFDFATRQVIEIARACVMPQEVLGIENPVVLLDEPTSALGKAEEEAFFALLRRLRERGSVLFVSHRLGEVLAVSDVICVLKDGRLVATVDPTTADDQVLHGLMVGRERDADYYHEREQRCPPPSPPLFAANRLTHRPKFFDTSFEVAPGEVLGIGGLLDSGKAALAKAAAGLLPIESGTVAIGDAAPALPDFSRLVAQGLGYVPSERHQEGIIAEFPVAWNVSLAGGADLFSNALGLWRTARETEVTRRWIAELRIKSAEPLTACSTLSGGNQQKVVLARWLCRAPKVLILDNPTRGVDAGAKEEIYALVRRLTAAGLAIVLVTDELLELIGLSHRIAIMRHGVITAVLDAPPGAKPSERELVALMLGIESAAAPGAWLQ